MIADSSFVIDIMRTNEDALQKLELIQQGQHPQYLASPSVMELAVGLSLAKLPSKEQKRIDSILEEFQILPLDAVSAWWAGLEIGRLKGVGISIDPIDAQIAGIAVQHKETVVTRNLRHFERFQDLSVESY
ncbi:MAG: PIN domain-containing protein [Candidatus Lokiarchaeota archaeon]|nr:PIN domain-containing protein [Candidatus Lokiarchaeota archaeon]